MKLVVSILALALVAVPSMAGVVYSDSFESYAVGSKAGNGWDNWFSANQVTDLSAKTGSKSVNVTAGGTLGQDAVPFVSQGTAQFSFKENEGHLQFFVYITNGNEQVYSRVLVSYWSGILNSTTAGYQSPAVVPGSGGVSLGVWHDLAISFDMATKKQNISLDGQVVGANLPFYNSAVAGTGNQLRVYIQELSAAGTTLIDDFSLTAVPEPASMSLLGLGVLALVRRVRK